MDQNHTSRFEKFETWMTGQFWFYYKWYFIFAVFVLSFIIIYLVTLVTEVQYDWNVTYAHYGQSDSRKVREITKLLERYATDVTGNGQVNIKVTEITDFDNDSFPTEQNFFLALTSDNTYITVTDKYMYDIISGLGYFDDLQISDKEQRCIYVESLDLYFSVSKGPSKQYTQAQADNAKITQSQLEDMNEELRVNHEQLYNEAMSIVRGLGQQ